MTEKPSILVVEDEAKMRRLLELELADQDFLAQTVAIQTHIHFSDTASSSVAASAGDRTDQIVSAAQLPAGDAADCPLCRELATAGHYILQSIECRGRKLWPAGHDGRNSPGPKPDCAGCVGQRIKEGWLMSSRLEPLGTRFPTSVLFLQ